MKQVQKKLIEVDLSDLKPFNDNPRHNNASAKMVAKSIDKFGYICPIVTNEDLVILSGNTRYKALKLLGIKRVDVIVVTGLSEKEQLEFVIADNRIGEYSTWNASAISRIQSSENSEFLNDIGMKNAKQTEDALRELIYGK